MKSNDFKVYYCFICERSSIFVLLYYINVTTHNKLICQECLYKYDLHDRLIDGSMNEQQLMEGY